MNADFNLHDEVFLGGKAGKILGLLEGGQVVMIRFTDGTDQTIDANHPYLLTAKQKATRERVKIAQEKIAAQMTEGGRKTEVAIPPALRKAESVTETPAVAEAPVTETPVVAEAPVTETPVVAEAPVTETPVVAEIFRPIGQVDKLEAE